MRRTIPIAFVLAALLTACGGSKSSPSGWETHRVEGEGFTISSPAAWRTVRDLDKEAVDEFVEKNPKLAQFAPLLKSGVIKFFAVDPEVVEEFATNLNVLVHELPQEMSLEEYAEASKASARSLKPLALESSIVTLPEGRALRMTYEYEVQASSGAKRLAILQYGIVRGGNEYVVTYTTLPQLRERYRGTFERSARSFRID